MINFKLANDIKARIEKLDDLFNQICDTASVETQEKLIDRINELKGELKSATAKKPANWSEELAALNID